MCRDAHLKSSDEPVSCSYSNSSPTSVSKQRKITENAGSLSTNSQALDAVAAQMSALTSVSEAVIVDNSKHEAMEPEVVSSDMDFGGLDDDPSAFCDILKTINGCEFTCTSEFQKCLDESERDENNLNFSASDLTCLSVNDVTDAVTDKQSALQRSTAEHLTSLQTAALPSLQSIPSLLMETKYVEVPLNAPSLPADSYCMQPWQQSVPVHQPLMHHLQLLPTSVPSYWPDDCPELIKHNLAVQVKQRPTARRQLQSHAAQNLPRIQHLHQQQPQRNQAQSWCPPHASAQNPQQYDMTAEQQTWLQQDWQASMQAQQQLFPCLSAGMSSCTVKKETSLSAIVSSVADAAARPPQQMSSLSENAGHGQLPHACAAAYTNLTAVAPAYHSIYASREPRMLAFNQSQHPPPGVYVNFSDAVVPDFCSASNFVSHGAAGQLFGHANEVQQVRVVTQGLDGACPTVPANAFVSESDHFITH